MHKTTRPAIFVSLLLLAIGLCVTHAAQAQTRIVDEIDTVINASQKAIRIRFNFPLQYINHAPLTAHDEVQIQLRSPSSVDLTDTETQEQQILTWRPTARIPLLDVQYETLSSNRGTLLLRFKRPVLTQVRSSADARSLWVELAPDPDKPLRPRTQAMTAATPEGPIQAEGRFVLNLASSLDAVAVPILPTEIARGRALYVTRLTLDGRVWNRLRLGFYRTRAEALRAQTVLRQQYPKAWIDTASDREIRKAIGGKGSVDLPKPAPPRTAVRPIKPVLPKVADERIAELMAEARLAMTQANYTRAVQLYTKVLLHPDHPYRQTALEFLGLARERKGQIAHAKAEYERYLALYPEGEDADRVRQRLAGLTTARQAPRERRRTARRAEERPEWEVYGGFSQFYRRDVSITDVDGATVNQSSLTNDLDVTARRRGEQYDIQTRFTGSYLADFLEDSDGDESRVSSLYLDATAKGQGISTRIGRQTHNTGGVLGRFDGALLSYPLSARVSLNAVTGFPVASTRDDPQSHRYFYGLSADIGTFANAWDFVAFVIEQRNDGLVDRRAIGGEVRYFDPTRSLLSFVDYDVFYQELNTFLLLGTWTLPSRTTVNMNLDLRNSPILTTQNALQGQGIETLDELKTSFSDDTIQTLAQDRTADSKSVTLGVSHPVSDRYQVSGDVTVTRLGGTIASGGVEATPATGNEYFYNVQLIGSDLFKPGDISILGLRFSDTSSAESTAVTLNTRYPITRDWRLNPRLRFDYRTNKRDDSTQLTAAPSLRMDYRWRRKYRFEAELGGEWSSRDLTDTTERDKAYFFSLGYRADF